MPGFCITVCIIIQGIGMLALLWLGGICLVLIGASMSATGTIIGEMRRQGDRLVKVIHGPHLDEDDVLVLSKVAAPVPGSAPVPNAQARHPGPFPFGN